MGGGSNTAENELKESIILGIKKKKKKILGSNRSVRNVCWSKHGIFPIKDFIHIALVKGLFCLLALPLIQELRKSPHILHNLLQRVPAATANNTSISSGSRQTAPSAAIWASSQTLSNTSPDKARKIQHNISEPYPITSVTGDESTERARKPSPFITKMAALLI